MTSKTATAIPTTTTTTTITATTATTAATTATTAFETIKKYVVLFGAISAIVLGTVAVMSFTHHTVTTFMWVRGGILLAIAPMLHRFATKASEGSPAALDHIRTLATVMPIALIGVDLIPGLCPAWYAVLQGLSALALVAVAIITRSAAVRDAA
ncbi:hypothetical protein GCM10009839_28110 [Catenulispora yoronensis]|uniref:Integral membrane protein n=1 Tax=Catenulispora yoronensis TaxID=450799 RepID=A0ABP5FJ43_9ACTN